MCVLSMFVLYVEIVYAIRVVMLDSKLKQKNGYGKNIILFIIIINNKLFIKK